MLRLPPDLHDTLVSALRPGGRTPSGSQRRRFTRTPVHAAVELVTKNADGKPHRYTGVAHDLSGNGIGFLQSAPMPKGTGFLLCVRAPAGDLTIVCRATFCSKVADGIYGIGAQFESLSSGDPAGNLNDMQEQDQLRKRIEQMVLEP